MVHREINPDVRTLDDRTGIIEYVASDQTIDAQREVIRAAGWRFDRMQKNAPFVDSHRYGSIESLLGKVIDFKVDGSHRLVETVQWAIDVPENYLAKLGYGMAKAGYQKAVSVGFQPEVLMTMKPSDDWPEDWSGARVLPAGTRQGKPLWQQQMADLGIAQGGRGPDTVYVQQQQLELSACVIGCNPSALARSYREGILTFETVVKITASHPDFSDKLERALHRGGRSYSFPSEHKSAERETMKSKILEAFGRTDEKPAADTKSALDRLEFIRRGQSPSELERAVYVAMKSIERERRIAKSDPIAAALSNEENRFWWDTMARYLAGGQLDGEQARLASDMKALREEMRSVVKGLDTTSTMIGFPIPVSTDVYNLLLIYGAFRDLGVRPMLNSKTKFAKISALPNAVFITPTATGAGRALPVDTALAGDSVTQQANTVGAIIEISQELAEDQQADLSGVILEMFVQAIAARLDYAAFRGDGTDDQTSGAQTGIFSDNTVASVSAGIGNTTVQALQRGDFLSAVDAVAPAALQRPCRWFISTSFIAKLLTLKDGNGPKYLLKTPAETGGEWHLVGFPVTWTAQAPSTNTPGSKVAAFGEPNSYLVGVREDFEIGTSDSVKFSQALRQIRGLARARCDMREATGWATLKLAPQ